MTFQPPEAFNIAEYFLDARIGEGRGDRPALLTDRGTFTFRDMRSLANRWGNMLRDTGVEPEQRVIVALPDGPEFVAALFGTVKIGAVVVMVNPYLRPEEIGYFLEYTRAKIAIVHTEQRKTFAAATGDARHLHDLVVVGDPAWDDRVAAQSDHLETFPSHRDDAVIWLFSGGTTGQPKAVVQTHAAFANTTELYGKGVLGLTERDITISVPKLFFGYATGSNLFFPFSVGAAAVLFPDRCTPAGLFEKIEEFRPTILVNVPTMINQMLSEPDANQRDLSSLRLVTSAGEALPADLHERWMQAFGVELLDGLGTAEMWHIFISNRPGQVRPGTLGTVVPGFDVKVCDDDGTEVLAGEIGALWVRGDSRAIGYWQQMEKTRAAFRGEWYVSGDMISRDAEGYVTYCGRADDMLKVSGKWLSPQEVESCLRRHPAVHEVAVVGIEDEHGLIRPHAFIVGEAHPDLDAELANFVRERLARFKVPRRFVLLATLPRTHLGKVDRGKLRRSGLTTD